MHTVMFCDDAGPRLMWFVYIKQQSGSEGRSLSNLLVVKQANSVQVWVVVVGVSTGPKCAGVAGSKKANRREYSSNRGAYSKEQLLGG